MGALAAINFFFSLCMLATDYWLEWKAKEFDSIAATCFAVNMIFLVDMVMNFVVLGPIEVFKTKGFLYLELLT